MKTLVRDNVTNSTSKSVIEAISDKQKSYSFTPQDGDDFLALLGTPNLTSVTYLILDHGSELQIEGIEKIECDISKDYHMQVTFKPVIASGTTKA